MKRDTALGFIAKCIVWLEKLTLEIKAARFKQAQALVQTASNVTPIVDYVEVVIIREDNTVLARYKELRPHKRISGAVSRVDDYVGVLQ